jgi:hypothetical protein
MRRILRKAEFGPNGEIFFADDPRHSEVKKQERFWVILQPDSVALPASESIVGVENGGATSLLPIVDEDYGGVIAWANTVEQAGRIVDALKKAAA